MVLIVRTVVILTCVGLSEAVAQTVWLDELDLSTMECGWGSPQPNRSIEEHALRVGGKSFDRGIGTHAVSTFLLNLDGEGMRFRAMVGIDDEADGAKASAEFVVLGDQKVMWSSGVMHRGDSARTVDVDLNNIRLVGLLVTDAGDGIDYDHADWCDARFELAESRDPGDFIVHTGRKPYILTPPAPKIPRINGATVVGVRPGSPVLIRVAATGDQPITFGATDLPAGLTLDSATGIITGTVTTEGTYQVMIAAQNERGYAERGLTIVVGKTICLTPPMGWNSWNCWACAVSDDKVRAAADAMVATRLIDHGWTYINIDDCWMVQSDTAKAPVGGAPRDSSGMINANAKFPDMNALADYVHSLGLKLGIYSSPGPFTCAGYTASYQHESRDAVRFAQWGIDYLKYDWCSYGSIARDKSVAELKKPYLVMRDALDNVRRDIVFSLCQYGMGNVWEWGADVGGNCWRTTGDITDTWSSMSRIGFGQAGHEAYAGPGHWNDPDMLVVGKVGWGPDLHATHLTPDEQYTHISLWCLLSAPLLIGCDLGDLDEFTLSLLTNDEVIDIDQDPAGKQARRIADADGKQIWVKDMADGSKAVGLFNVGESHPENVADRFAWTPRGPERMAVSGSDIGMNGKFIVRDLWRQKDLGTFDGSFSADVPYHGVVLLRVHEEK